MVQNVTLTLQVDDLDANDWVKVYVKPAAGPTQDTWTYLGELNPMSFSDQGHVIPGADIYEPGHMTITEFSLDPSWLNGLPVGVRLSGFFRNPNQVEIETSTLGVQLVPAPAAVLLGGIGLGVGGWWMRKRIS